MQVVFEVGTFSLRGEAGRTALDRYVLGGFVFGVAFMYLTALAIKV